jgi:hypothetical protein
MVSDNLRGWKELDSFLDTHTGCHWVRLGEERSHLPVQESGSS